MDVTKPHVDDDDDDEEDPFSSGFQNKRLDYARAARVRLRMRACEEIARAHVYCQLQREVLWVATLLSESGAIRERDEMPKERRKRTRDHQQRCQQGKL